MLTELVKFREAWVCRFEPEEKRFQVPKVLERSGVAAKHKGNPEQKKHNARTNTFELMILKTLRNCRN